MHDSNHLNSTPYGVWPYVICPDTHFVRGPAYCTDILGHGRAWCRPSGADTDAAANHSCVCGGLWGSRRPAVAANVSFPPTVGDDPRLGCDEWRPPMYYFVVIWTACTLWLCLALASGVALTTQVCRAHRRSGTKSCGAGTKIMLPVISNVLACAFLLGHAAQFLLWPIANTICPIWPTGYFVSLPPAIFFWNVACTTVSLQWTQISSNARAFRKTSPASAIRMAWLFTGGISAFSAIQTVVFVVVLDRATFSMGLYAITTVAIALLYFFAAKKLRRVLGAVSPVSGGSKPGCDTRAESRKSGESRSAEFPQATPGTGEKVHIAVRRSWSSSSMLSKKKAQATNTQVQLIWRTASRLLAISAVGILTLLCMALSVVFQPTGYMSTSQVAQSRAARAALQTGIAVFVAYGGAAMVILQQYFRNGIAHSRRSRGSSGRSSRGSSQGCPQ